MLKRVTLTVASILILFPGNGFCTVQNDLTVLDAQRNEALKQIATGLTEGKISVQDAEKLKKQLDNIIKLETQANEDPLSSPERIQGISSSLQQIHKSILDATHPEKIWLGLSSRDRSLEQKITDALTNKTLTKEQAENFKQQLDELRARESNGDPSHAFEFEDAMALAVDVQTFNSNLDKAIAGK